MVRSAATVAEITQTAFIIQGCGCSPLLFGQNPRCAPTVWLNWPWSSGCLTLCVNEQDFARCYPSPPTPLPQWLTHPSWSLEPSVRRVRRQQPSTLSHMTLKSERSVAYWFACVCAIPNCDWHLQRSQFLSTLHWTVLPESFLPTVPELISEFL